MYTERCTHTHTCAHTHTYTHTHTHITPSALHRARIGTAISSHVVAVVTAQAQFQSYTRTPKIRVYNKKERRGKIEKERKRDYSSPARTPTMRVNHKKERKRKIEKERKRETTRDQHERL